MLHSNRCIILASLCSAGIMLGGCSSSNNDTDTNESQASPTIDLVPSVGDSSIGKVYTAGENNLTLYTASFEPNTVACDAVCEAIWPPLLTTITQTGISGQFDVFARADGQSQWTLNGLLLHFYAGDAAASDVSGEAVDGQFFVARPIPVDSASGPGGEEITVASGTVLVPDVGRIDKNGFALYTFANDTDGVSNCNDGCATTWPPLYADAGARAFDRYSLIVRADSSSQWAYDGNALYFYTGDNTAGDTNGDGVGGVWSVVMP